MRTTNIARTLGLAVTITVAVQGAQAQVVGTLNASGGMSLQQATLGPGNPVTVSQTVPLIAAPTPNGIFTTIAPGTTGTVQTVTLGVGAFNVPNYITIGGFTFALNTVFAGDYTGAACAAPPAPGQACTPPGTPFDLVNTPTGTTLTFSVGGVVTAPSSATFNYTGNYTAQFAGMTMQQIYQELISGTPVATSYSLAVQATQRPITTPEPTTFAMLAPGLIGLAGVVRIRRARRRVP